MRLSKSKIGKLAEKPIKRLPSNLRKSEKMSKAYPSKKFFLFDFKLDSLKGHR